jgi:hypothetical protein
MSTKRIFNLELDPPSNSDATSKAYVDLQIDSVNQLTKLREVNLMTPSVGDIMAFTGTGNHVISTSFSGDIGGTFTSSNTSTLAADYLSGSTASTITIASGAIAGFPSAGFLKIDNEVFQYTGKTPVSNRFDGVTRAKFLTVAADHLTGAAVFGLDNSSINLQIQPNVIVNADVSATAAIEQSKLNLTNVTSYVDTATDSVLGKASFSTDNFSVTTGAVTIKNKGIAYAEIQDVAAGSILGNLTGLAATVQEVSTSGIVQNGINSLFTTIDDGAFVMTRRYNSLKNSSSFITLIGTAISSGPGSFLDVPVSNISGSGVGARVTVGRTGVTYSGVAVTYGGQGYAEGDQLFVSGLLLGGSPANDLTFTVETTGTNIDTVVYLGVQRVSQTAAASSIVKTDASSNLGNSANKYNNVYATTFIGALTGNASTATTATNLAGTGTGSPNSIIGSIPYQSANDTTLWLGPGTTGRYLKTNGPGVAPSWSELVIPDGSAENLTGTTLASGVVNSSLTSVGVLTSLSISGHAQFSVNSSVTAITTGTGTVITKDVNIIVTCPAGGKVQLPVAVAGYKIFIRNNGANDLAIYPATGATINGGPANDPSAAPIVPGAGLEFICGVGATGGVGGDWYNLDATFA